MMSRTTATLLVCATIVLAALWVRYESLDPCDWVVPALAAKTGLPEIALALALPAGTTLDSLKRYYAGQPRNECVQQWLRIQFSNGPGANR